MTILANPIEPTTISIDLASVSNWVKVYWPELEDSFDTISSSIGNGYNLFAELVNETAFKIGFYDTSGKSTSEILRARALMVCVEAAGMPGIAGYEEQRHYKTLKIMDRTWTKEEGIDQFVGELLRILPEYTRSDSSKYTTISGTKAIVDSVFTATRLDQRSSPYTERDIGVLRDLWNNDEDNSGADL